MPPSTSSALALAGRLRSLDDGALGALLRTREVSATGIKDFFDLAERLLSRESVQACLARLDRPTLLPSSHSIFTCRSACIACQGVSAITATAAAPPMPPGTASTLRTPGNGEAARASKRPTVPPITGHIATVA